MTSTMTHSCISNFTGSTVPNALIGNGFCDDETNNGDCNYDGGDCCVDLNKDHCSACTCFHEENCVNGFFPSIIADGFCNDETNNEVCHYDGGDCCQNVTTNHCTICSCFYSENCAAGYFPSFSWKILGTSVKFLPSIFIFLEAKIHSFPLKYRQLIS